MLGFMRERPQLDVDPQGEGNDAFLTLLRIVHHEPYR